MSMLLDQVKADTGISELTTERSEPDYPMLKLQVDSRDKYPLRIGLENAKRVLVNLQAIRAFVQTLEEQKPIVASPTELPRPMMEFDEGFPLEEHM